MDSTVVSVKVSMLAIIRFMVVDPTLPAPSANIIACEVARATGAVSSEVKHNMSTILAKPISSSPAMLQLPSPMLQVRAIGPPPGSPMCEGCRISWGSSDEMVNLKNWHWLSLKSTSSWQGLTRCRLTSIPFEHEAANTASKKTAAVWKRKWNFILSLRCPFDLSRVMVSANEPLPMRRWPRRRKRPPRTGLRPSRQPRRR